MTTERDLDTRLLAARGVQDADLPALPAAFLDHLHTSDVPQPEAVPASVLAAQQLVQDARDRRGAVGRRTRRPGRRSILGVGVAVLTAAAAWTAAVLVTGPEFPAPSADGVTLVAFDMPAFPLTLPAAPPGTTGPVFGGDGGGGASMSYVSTENAVDSVNVHTGTEPLPNGSDDFTGAAVDEAVTVDDRPGRLIVMNTETADFRVAYLDWERGAGQWVTLFGQGRYADGDQLTALAEQLVDSPQTVPLQLHLAPAGWRLDFFKDNGRIVRLVDAADPEQGLTVHVPLPDEIVSADRFLETVEGAVGPVEQVTVQGQPAHVVRTDFGGGYEGWYLQARFPDGTTFVVQAPGTLTQEQVVQIADQVTYTP